MTGTRSLPRRSRTHHSPDRPEALLSWSQVHRFRVARHSLAERAERSTAETVLLRVGGVQAQLLSAADQSLWCRVAGWRQGELARALDRDRSIVRTWCMRRTLFIVPAPHLATFGRGTQRRAEKEVTWTRRHGISARELDRLLDAVGEALTTPVDRRTLASLVADRLGRPVAARRGYGWGSPRSVPAVKVGRWNVPAQYMLQLYGARGPVCVGPVAAGKATYVRGDRWVPGFRDREVPDAERQLLRLYLGAYAPATPADFSRWAGIGVRAATEIWNRLGDEVVPVEVDGWRAGGLRSDLESLSAPIGPAPSVRLLPYFDTYLLGHESRAHLVGPRHHRRVYRNQGWIAPTLLVDGRVAATWRFEVDGARLRITLDPLERLSAATQGMVRDEADGLAEFVGCERAAVGVARGAGRRRPGRAPALPLPGAAA